MVIKGDGFTHLGMKPNFFHVVVGAILIAAMVLLHFQLTPNFDLSAVVSIGFFNVLFLFLLFPLEGPLIRKTVLLIGGNTVGVLWYFVQLSLADAFSVLNTDTFKIITLIVTPLIDFVWIVAVWSLSLSMLVSYRVERERLEKS